LKYLSCSFDVGVRFFGRWQRGDRVRVTASLTEGVQIGQGGQLVVVRLQGRELAQPNEVVEPRREVLRASADVHLEGFLDGEV
jgi:hypothetical protein